MRIATAYYCGKLNDIVIHTWNTWNLSVLSSSMFIIDPHNDLLPVGLIASTDRALHRHHKARMPVRPWIFHAFLAAA